MTKKTGKIERLLEVSAMRRPAAVDTENGVIRGVKLLGPVSENGRTYTESALKKAVSLYEGAKVNVNHRRGPGDRDYRDRIGVIRNVESKTSGLYGDLHYNPKHALAEQLAWDAQHAPENVGLSHDAQGRTRNEGGKVLVEEITKVNSVDLVSDPATVRSLFESEGMMDPMTPTTDAGTGTVKTMILDGVAKILDGDGEPNAKAAAIKTLVAKLLKVEADLDAALSGGDKPAEAPSEAPAATPESKQDAPTVGDLQERVRYLEAKDHGRRLLAEAKIEASETLVESLALLPTDAARKSLVESLPKAAAQPADANRPKPQPRSAAPSGQPLQESVAVPEKREDFVKLFKS